VIGADNDIEFTVTPERLKLVFRANAALVKQFRKKARIERAKPRELALPYVEAVYSLARERRENAARPVFVGAAELIRMEGAKLSFDQSDLETGVYFIRSDSSVTAVKEFALVGTKRVIFKCPDLAPGDYHLVVRTRPTATAIRQAERFGPVRVET
jgi:hypothetical protein